MRIRDTGLQTRQKDKMLMDGEDLTDDITLSQIIKGVKNSLNGKKDEYISIIIFGLVGSESEVVEAELDVSQYIDQDMLACRSLRLTLSDCVIKEDRE